MTRTRFQIASACALLILLCSAVTAKPKPDPNAKITEFAIMRGQRQLLPYEALPDLFVTPINETMLPGNEWLQMQEIYGWTFGIHSKKTNRRFAWKLELRHIGADFQILEQGEASLSADFVFSFQPVEPINERLDSADKIRLYSFTGRYRNKSSNSRLNPFKGLGNWAMPVGTYYEDGRYHGGAANYRGHGEFVLMTFGPSDPKTDIARDELIFSVAEPTPQK